MRQPETMENLSGVDFQAHTLDLSPCCPVSCNPRPGSVLTISYRPQAYKLEVAALYAYIHQFRGGLRDEQGVVIVRDMEGMLHRVAQDCADAVRVPVGVSALLVIAPQQHVMALYRARPCRQQKSLHDVRPAGSCAVSNTDIPSLEYTTLGGEAS